MQAIATNVMSQEQVGKHAIAKAVETKVKTYPASPTMDSYKSFFLDGFCTWASH